MPYAVNLRQGVVGPLPQALIGCRKINSVALSMLYGRNMPEVLGH
jgi:hypothetical protein